MIGLHPKSENGSTRLVTMLIAGAVAVAAVGGWAYTRRHDGEIAGTPTASAPVTLSSNHVNFGRVLVGEDAVRNLIVRNDGTDAIRAVVETNGVNFSVDRDEWILHPGVNTRITVAMRSDKPGSAAETLSLRFRDLDAGPLAVRLTGSVDRRPEPGSAGAVAAARPALPTSDALEALPSSAEAYHQDDTRRLDARTRRADRRTASGSSFTTVARAAVGGQNPGSASAGSQTSGPGVTSKATARRPVTRTDQERLRGDSSGRTATRNANGMSVQVRPYDAATAVPYQSISDATPTVEDGVGANEDASEIPSRLPDEDLPETLPEDPAEDDDMFDDDDIFEDDDDDSEQEEDPFVHPTLTISGQSTVRVMGSQATFYPQALGINGSDLGGPLSVIDALQFPTVPLAFGESMLFSQSGGLVGGSYDPASGSLELQLQAQAIDSDGDAAPLNLALTTGTVLARNEAGNLVQMSGSPASSSGILRLVAIEKIPVGFKNGGEEHLAVFEILAQIDFGNGNSTPSVHSFGRIGG